MTDAVDGGAKQHEERRAISVASGAHALHDGYTDLIYIMLPVWQAEFGLSYAAIGLLRGFYAGTMALLQMTATRLSGRFGPAAILALGTGLAGFGYCLAGLSGSFAFLLVALIVGGIGASAQHPIASEMVARAYAGPRAMKAMGGYNFAGDIGKMTLPALAALMLAILPWRPTLLLLGAVGLVAAFLIYRLAPKPATGAALRPDTDLTPQADPPKAMRGAFGMLMTIGIIDSATRMGFLTFLPFILAAKGASLPTVGLALTLVFAGGAVGKLVCAWLGARIGMIATVLLTEIATPLLILALLPLPLMAGMALLPLLGVALNGTSSVLYGSVPALVTADKRERAFGMFYTGTIGAGAVAPIVYGMIGDVIGLPGGVMVVAGLVVITVPLVLLLRPAFAQRQSPRLA